MSANKAFYILLSSFSLALIGLSVLLVKSLPLTLAQAIYFCQKTLSDSTILPSLLPFLLVISTIGILIVGVLTFGIQIVKTRRYLKKNMGKRVVTPKIVQRLGKKLNLEGKIDVIKDINQFSFCYGIIKPRICLSTGLIKKLNSNELQAVILHESYHLRNFDPLKIVISKVAAQMFFFIPTLRDIQKYYALSKEIEADKVATQTDSRKSLLSALSKLITIDTPQYAGVAGLANIDSLEKRIKFLAGAQNQNSFRLSLFNLSLSITIVLVSFMALTAPVHAMSMDDQSMDTSYCVCPYDDRCSKQCQYGLLPKETNFSEIKLYTPIKGGTE